jgi:hypothetical protein
MEPSSGPRTSPGAEGASGIPDGLLVGILAFLLGLTTLVWTATGLAGLFARGAWPKGVHFAHTPVAMRHLFTSPHDLKGAWPDAPVDQLPGYGLFWGVFISELMVLFVAAVFAIGTVARWRIARSGRSDGSARRSGARWRSVRPGARPTAAAAEAETTGAGASAAPVEHKAPAPDAVDRAPAVGTPPTATRQVGPPAQRPHSPAEPGAAPYPGLAPQVGTPSTVVPPASVPPSVPSSAVPAPGEGGPGPSAGVSGAGLSGIGAAGAGVPYAKPPGPDSSSAKTPYAGLRATGAHAAGGHTAVPMGGPAMPAVGGSHGGSLPGQRSGSGLHFTGPRSGIHKELAAQAIRNAEGAVLVTTSDPALWAETKDARAKLGPTHLYDPSHLLDTPARLRWSPSAGCESREIAAVRAAALLAPVRPSHALDSALAEAAETLLRCWLHAAALDGRPFRQVHRWASGNTAHEPVRILRTHPKAASGSAGELENTLTGHPERREMAQQLTARALSALSSIHIRDACNPTRAESLAVESFVAEGGTLYVVGEAIEDPRTHPGAMPLLTALVSSVVEHGRRMAERSSAGRLDPPLTLVLDDVAAVAPLPQLPQLLAEGAAQGLPALALLRSEEQARARWPNQGLVS